MGVVLDTRLVPPQDRLPLLVETFTGFAPVRIQLEKVADLRGSIQTWQLPDVPALRYAANTGLILKNEESADDRQFVLAVQTSGQGTVTQFGVEHRFGAGELVCIDRHRPFDFGWTGAGGSVGVHLSAAQLDLPAKLIRQGADRLSQHPLAGLLANHLACFSDQSIGDEASAEAAGRTTIDLFRALILSVTTGEPSTQLHRWARVNQPVPSEPSEQRRGEVLE